MKNLISNIVGATLGIWLSASFVPGTQVNILPDSNFFGINLTAAWHIFFFLGVILGFLNFFIKPILNAITLPLRIITLGLFGFVINGGLVWILDAIFKEFSAPLLYPLLWTTLIIWGINLVLSLFIKDH